MLLPFRPLGRLIVTCSGCWQKFPFDVLIYINPLTVSLSRSPPQQQYQSQQHYALSGNHQVNPQQQAHNNRVLIESKTQSQSQSPQPQSSQPPQVGGGNRNVHDNSVININNHRDREDDIDDDILTFLSSISLSEARKYHHSKRSQKNQRSGKGSEPRYESPGIPRYRLLVVDDR